MELHQSVMAFFHEAVTGALRSRGVDAGPPTEFYLVNLLAEFTSASHLDQEPLALKMAQAAGGSPELRLSALKNVGDTSLYVSGFFADSLNRKLVDVDYYIAMGGSAYAQLAHLLTVNRPAARELLSSVFDELAHKFPQFVEVLGEIRAGTSFASPTNLVRLCEEWLRTGSEWAEKRLRASGLVALDALAPANKLKH